MRVEGVRRVWVYGARGVGFEGVKGLGVWESRRLRDHPIARDPECPVKYRGTSPIRKRPPSRTPPGP